MYSLSAVWVSMSTCKWEFYTYITLINGLRKHLFGKIEVVDFKNRDFTDKPNRNENRIESESAEESKGDINIF